MNAMYHDLIERQQVQILFELTPDGRRAILNARCAEQLQHKREGQSYADAYHEFWLAYSDECRPVGLSTD